MTKKKKSAKEVTLSKWSAARATRAISRNLFDFRPFFGIHHLTRSTQKSLQARSYKIFNFDCLEIFVKESIVSNLRNLFRNKDFQAVSESMPRNRRNSLNFIVTRMLKFGAIFFGITVRRARGVVHFSFLFLVCFQLGSPFSLPLLTRTRTYHTYLFWPDRY